MVENTANEDDAMKVLKVDYRSPNAAKDFTRSLKETGFGVLTNHPIEPKLINDTFKDWEDFFKTESKFKYKFDPAKQEGYFPFRTENAKNNEVKDLKEFYHFYPWSKLPEGMRNNTLVYFEKVTNLAIELLNWIESESPKEVREGFSMPLSKMIENSVETLLRPIHYPPMDGREEKGAIRAAAHEDINLITLLPAATAPGLEVMDTAGNWHEVPCDLGSFAINSGDMLQMASNGYFKSTTHRVVNPEATLKQKPRYSMPLFLHPAPSVLLTGKTTARMYLEERLREIGLLKTDESKR